MFKKSVTYMNVMREPFKDLCDDFIQDDRIE